MSHAANLWIFFTLLFGILIVPGMDMLFVIASALNAGRIAGLSATVGIMLGGVVHSAFGIFLVTALTHVSPDAFQPLVIIGALYMTWLGCTLARSSIQLGKIENGNDSSVAKVLIQGLLTCLLNPKAYLFVIAVYPQFLRPEYGSVGMQGLLMGTMTVLMQGAIYGSIAISAGKARLALISSPKIIIYLGRSIGVMFILIAAYTLWHGTFSKG